MRQADLIRKDRAAVEKELVRIRPHIVKIVEQLDFQIEHWMIDRCHPQFFFESGIVKEPHEWIILDLLSLVECQINRPLASPKLRDKLDSYQVATLQRQILTDGGVIFDHACQVKGKYYTLLMEPFNLMCAILDGEKSGSQEQGE